jgi:hypothetical protein
MIFSGVICGSCPWRTDVMPMLRTAAMILGAHHTLLEIPHLACCCLWLQHVAQLRHTRALSYKLCRLVAPCSALLGGVAVRLCTDPRCIRPCP